MPKTPALFQLTSAERKNSLDEIIEGATPDTSFYMLLILSTVIVTMGLLLGSASVVIGGMLVAPLLSPLLSLAMGFVMADFQLIRQSTKIIVASILVVLVIALLMGLLAINVEENEEIMQRINPSLGYLLVAISAGVAAAFAQVRPKLSEALPGIAVSIALLPPLCVSSLGIVLGKMEVFTGSLGLFVLNLFGIIVASIIIFGLMGFFEQREEAQERLEEDLKEQEQAKSKS